MKYLKYLFYVLIVCLLLALIPFLWIPGLIFIAYLLLKKTPVNQKTKKLVISGVATAFSLILFLFSMFSTPKLESCTVAFGGKSFEIHDTVTLEIDAYPENSKIHSLEISDNDIADLEYKDGKGIITFKKEGTATIFFKANDSVKSNSTSITVTDPVAEAKREAARKQEEERKKAEQEAKKKAEEEARIRAEQEAKKKAEEEARIKAEQEAKKKAEEEAKAAASQEQNTSATVYWVPNGEVYHSTPDCSTLKRSKNIYSGTVSESGKSRPCKVCH